MANGQITSHAYDQAGRETALTNTLHSGAVLTAHTATYDPVGNRVGVQETINTEGSFGVTYTYDQANQLLSEQRYGLSPYSNTFTYDPAGNQLSVTPASGVITTNTYNAANALTLSTPGTGQPTTLSCAAAGNRLTQNAAGTLTTFTWNYENRNTLLVSSTGVPLTNAYDATGIRRNDGTNTYVWDGLNVLQTRNPAASNAKVSQFTNFPGYWGGLVSQYNVATTSSLFYAFDQIGNTRLVSTPSGGVNSTFDYTAFGTEYHVTGGTGILFRFNGKWGLVRPSSVAWLLYAMQRWVDFQRAQWVSRDLIGFGGGWNLYEFVRNNPERWVDPSGTVIAASSGLIAELQGSTLSGTVIGFQAAPFPPVVSAPLPPPILPGLPALGCDAPCKLVWLTCYDDPGAPYDDPSGSYQLANYCGKNLAPPTKSGCGKCAKTFADFCHCQGEELGDPVWPRGTTLCVSGKTLKINDCGCGQKRQNKPSPDNWLDVWQPNCNSWGNYWECVCPGTCK